MSIECGECERDLRGGHDESCSRFRGLINLTPHEVRIRTSDSPLDDELVLPPAAKPARVRTNIAVEEPLRIHEHTIPVQTIGYGGVEGLPAPRPGVGYVVSLLVLEVVKAQNSRFDQHAPAERHDVYAPATGPDDGAIRDARGQVIAVTRLVRA